MQWLTVIVAYMAIDCYGQWDDADRRPPRVCMCVYVCVYACMLAHHTISSVQISKHMYVCIHMYTCQCLDTDVDECNSIRFLSE